MSDTTKLASWIEKVGLAVYYSIPQCVATFRTTAYPMTRTFLAMANNPTESDGAIALFAALDRTPSLQSTCVLTAGATP